MKNRQSCSIKALTIALGLSILPITGTTLASDASGALSGLNMDRLDGVSLKMHRDQTRALLGTPQSIGSLEPDLTAEIYAPTENPSLKSVTLLFDPQEQLTGKALMLQGDVMELLMEKLLAADFIPVRQSAERIQLTGRDDDTGQPLEMTILRAGPDTLLMVFPSS